MPIDPKLAEGQSIGVTESVYGPMDVILYHLGLGAGVAATDAKELDAPIIHGMCSYGVACKAIVDEALGGDVARVARYSARFSGIFFPGETFEIAYWIEGDKIYVESSCKERQAPVISNAVITVR